MYALFREAPALICILRGPDHNYEFANPAYLEATGKLDIVGKSVRQAFPEFQDQGIFEILDTVYQEGKPFTVKAMPIRLNRGHGLEESFFTFTYQPLVGGAGVDGVMVFAYEVTQEILSIRKTERALANLAGQKHVLELVAQEAPLPKILEALAHILEGQLPGARASILLLDPDGRRLRHGAAPSLPESYNRSIDGVGIGAAVGSCGTAAHTAKAVIVSDIATDPMWEDWRALALGHGLRACWSTPILDSAGRVLGTFAMYFDRPRAPEADELQHLDILTRTAAIAIERKQSQSVLRETEAQLAHSQKMDAVGKMAGGIAHEFNNLLTAINGYTDLLLDLHKSDEPDKGYLSEVRKAGERAASLTRQLLAFGRKQMLTLKLLDLNEVVQGMRNMLRQVIGENIEFHIRLSSDLGRIKADPGQIEQVILNLVLNARDAMPYGGGITLETSDLILDGKSVTLPVPSGHYSVLAISDTGHGMDEITRARIFEPFFTTKEVGKGTGLGLSMVDGIIRQSGGHIRVHSAPGEGATFRIYMPREKRQVEEEKKPATAALPLTGKGEGTILVVEDEETVRKLVYHTLKSQGYTVWLASSGEVAMKLHQQHPGDPIHLLLTDVVMPGMSGRELAETLQPLRPEMKVMYMSGYTEDAVIRHGVSEEGATFLGKPFSPATLTDKIREVLAAAPDAA